MQSVSALLVATALFSSGLAFTFSISRFDDIKVMNINGKIQCDRIECPGNTFQCHVSKKCSEENPSKINREIVCFGPDGKILKKKSWSEVNLKNQIADIQIDMYADGRTSLINEGNSMDQNLFDGVASILQHIGNVISGFQDLFFNPFQGFI